MRRICKHCGKRLNRPCLVFVLQRNIYAKKNLQTWDNSVADRTPSERRAAVKFNQIIIKIYRYSDKHNNAVVLEELEEIKPLKKLALSQYKWNVFFKSKRSNWKDCKMTTTIPCANSCCEKIACQKLQFLNLYEMRRKGTVFANLK